MTPPRPRIGLALGSGSARGLAHLGVLQQLADIGITPDIICGTSMGALVGAVQACGQLTPFTDWVRTLRTAEIVRLLNLRLTRSQGGIADARHLFQHLQEQYGNPDIESLPVRYAAIATDLSSGQEIWLQQGPLWSAVRASCAIPSVLTPVSFRHHWLADGALVNPVPVSTCRALGADLVIAVNVNADLVGRQIPRPQTGNELRDEPEARSDSLLRRLQGSWQGLSRSIGERQRANRQAPGMLPVMSTAINIMQDRITRARLAGDPPDLLITPKLDQLSFFAFDRAEQAIAAGIQAVCYLEPQLRDWVRATGQP